MPEGFALAPYRAGDADYVVFRDAPRDLGAFYRQALERHGDAPFAVFENKRTSFADAGRIVRQLADALARAGIEPGDRVGIAMRNYPEWLWSFLAITASGAVAVCLNSWWSGEELDYGVRDSGMKLILADEERLVRLAGQPGAQAITKVAIRSRVMSDTLGWDEFLRSGNRQAPWPDLSGMGFEHPATILYTSGSTARPKGAVSSHRAIIHAVMGYEFGVADVAQRMQAKGRDMPPPAFPPALLVTAPLFHVTGLNSQFLLSLRLGRKIVTMCKWDATEALALIERERVTQFSGVPAMVSQLVNSPDYVRRDLSSLEAITGGGSAMTKAHSDRIAARTGGRVASRTGYGMTETNGLAATLGGRALKERPGSVGRAQPPLVSIHIANPEGQSLGPMEEGEVLICGAMNFSYYWNDPEATARTIWQGWVHSGDLGYLDGDGFLFLTGRLKDIINRGGEKISPAEVEAALLDHPAVFDCAVFGIADDLLGEAVACICEPAAGHAPDAAQLRAFLAGRLAVFKLPQHIRIGALPRLASGKVDRRAARASWEEESHG